MDYHVGLISCRPRIVALIATAMLGYGFGSDRNRALVFQGLFAVMVAMVLGLILDLDRPQRGIIRVNLSAMQRVQQAMGPPTMPSRQK